MSYSKQSVRRKRSALRNKKKQNLNSVFLICSKVFLVLVLTIVVAGGGLLYGSVKGIFTSTPLSYSLEPRFSATSILDDENNIVQYLSSYDSNRIIIDKDDLNDNIKNAFIAIEDERFYSHNGIDLKGIARALFNNIVNGSISEGASTITQQLIKNNVFDVGGESNDLAKVKRKIQEQYLAIRAEKEHTKEEILIDYLNTINLGKGTLGVEAAAKYYFGKKTSELTLSECSVIAGITKNPAYLNPVDYPAENKERRMAVLKKMLELEMITDEEYQEAVSDENVYARIEENVKNQKTSTIYSYFTDALILKIVEDLQTKLGYSQSQAYELVYRGGLQIYSTQNTELQKVADNIINDPDNYPKDTNYSLDYSLTVKHADESISTYNTADLRSYFVKKTKNKSYRTIYSSRKKMKQAAKTYRKYVVKDGDTVVSETIHYSVQPQASYTLIDQATGQVKVLIGGRGEKQDDLALNRATSVTRQPGSTFKILSTYAPALDTGGMTLGTVFDDCQYEYNDGTSVSNYEKKHFGLITIREAIKESNNIVAVKALTSLSPQVGFNYLLKLGFTTLVQNRTTNGVLESDVTQSLALGGITDGVTNVQLTAAYATIANKGVYNDPVLYTKVLDSNGNVLLENNSESKRLMKETTAWLLTNAMKDVVKSGTGKEAKLSSKMEVAGKTGTTSNNYDYWFCGYTPYYTASIWIGYDYNTDFESGADYHKEIWAKVMDKVIETTGQKVKSFDKCDNIETAKICVKSGKLAIDKLCDHDPEKSMVRTEYFEKGTAPTESCDVHVKLTLCKLSNKVAGKYCAKKHHYTKIYRKRPKGSKGTTDDSAYALTFDPSKDKNKCNVHTEAWYKKVLEILRKRKEAAEAATATNADGTPTNPTTDTSATTATKGATTPSTNTR